MRWLSVLLFMGVAYGAQPDLSRTATDLEEALAQRDTEATIRLISGIETLYPSGPEKDQKRAVKIVGKATRAKDAQIRLVAIGALGRIGAEGSSRYVKRWLTPPRKAEPQPVHYEAIKAAGKIADPSTLATLRKQSDHRHTEFAETATLAIGGYKYLSVKRRKALAFDLVKRLESLKNLRGGRGRIGGMSAGAMGGTSRAGLDAKVERMKRLAIATIRTLMELTGLDYRTLEEWQTWRKAAKRKRNPFG